MWIQFLREPEMSLSSSTQVFTKPALCTEFWQKKNTHNKMVHGDVLNVRYTGEHVRYTSQHHWTIHTCDSYCITCITGDRPATVGFSPISSSETFFPALEVISWFKGGFGWVSHLRSAGKDFDKTPLEVAMVENAFAICDPFHLSTRESPPSWVLSELNDTRTQSREDPTGLWPYAPRMKR